MSDYIGTWVGVDAHGVIKSGHIFTEDPENEREAIDFLNNGGGLSLHRLLRMDVRLNMPLSDYASGVAAGGQYQEEDPK